MFDWCRKVTPENRHHQCVFMSPPGEKYHHNLAQSEKLLPKHKLSIPSINIISSYDSKQAKPKKGISIHSQSYKFKSKNTSLSQNQMKTQKYIESATQTPKLFKSKNNQNQKSYLKSLISSQNNSPEQKKNTLAMKPFQKILSNPPLSPKYFANEEARYQSHKQTRSTNCYLQNVSENVKQMIKEIKQKAWVDSFHERQQMPMDEYSQEYENENEVDELLQQRFRVKIHRITNNEGKVQKCSSKEYENQAFLNVKETPVKGLEQFQLRNVKSVTKIEVDKPRLTNVFRLTPERRAMIMDRDTIISRQCNDFQDEDEKSMKIEESYIFQPEIKSQFIKLTPELSHNHHFSLYLAEERLLNLMVSIKQISISQMSQISEELLIYKEIEANKQTHSSSVLDLYQSYIDGNSYIFIKQPFTTTLQKYLENQTTKQPINFENILSGIQSCVLQMEKKQFYLRRRIEVSDIVFVFHQIKIHNADVFKIGTQHNVSIQSALNYLENEIAELII